MGTIKATRLPPPPRWRQRRRDAAPAVVLVRSLVHRFSDPLFAQLRLFLAPRHLYGPVKATMLAQGHAVAAGLVVAAVLTNHVRRVLAPWLGQFLWRHPVRDMKLARAAPHYFVEEQLLPLSSDDATDAAALGFWALQTCALATARALLRHRCLLLADDGSAATTTTTTTTTSTPADVKGRGAKAGIDGGGGGGGGSGGGSTGPSAAAKRTATATATASSACLTDGCRIAYLCLCLMRVEYAYAEACWAASWLHASSQLLLRGSTAERLFAQRLLTGDYHLARAADYPESSTARGHWRTVLLIAGLLLWWAWRAAQPLRRHGVAGVALSGLALAGGLVGVGTAHVVRYSNKYFIWLEMSEMLLTWAWLVLGVALVGAWRLCDGKSSRVRRRASV